MKYIKLNAGKRAIVDNEDYKRVFEFVKRFDGKGYVKWVYDTHKGYVWAPIKKDDGSYTSMLMHRLVMNTPKGMDTDHINGNKLDNRKKNLRICTRVENKMNSKISGNKWGYKCVEKYLHYNLWTSRPVLNGVRYYLGYHKTPELAHKAYMRFVKENHGEFSALKSRRRELTNKDVINKINPHSN